MKPLTPEGFQKIMETITHLKRRNKDLSTRLAQVEKSRDHWRAVALERSRILQQQRENRRRRTATRRHRGGVEEWRVHELIVKRILSIPARPK